MTKVFEIVRVMSNQFGIAQSINGSIDLTIDSTPYNKSIVLDYHDDDDFQRIHNKITKIINFRIDKVKDFVLDKDFAVATMGGADNAALARMNSNTNAIDTISVLAEDFKFETRELSDVMINQYEIYWLTFQAQDMPHETILKVHGQMSTSGDVQNFMIRVTISKEVITCTFTSNLGTYHYHLNNASY